MKKILSISILLILFLSTFYSSYAAGLGTKTVQVTDWCDLYFRHNGDLFQVPYVTYSRDGRTLPAYCINPNINGVGSDGIYSYSVSAENKITDARAWRILKNSYPYVSIDKLGVNSEKEAYYATKVALMAVLGPRNPDDYTVTEGQPSRVHDLFKKLVAIANDETDVYENVDKIFIAIAKDWTIEGEYIAKTYKIDSVIRDGKYQIKLTGNLPEGSKLVDENNKEVDELNLTEKFKILVPLDKLIESYEYTLTATSRLKTYPIYQGVSSIEGRQDYALVGEEKDAYETVTYSLSEKSLKNTTKITIIKKEFGSEKKLAGVKFNLLDSNMNLLHQNLITDENGQIEITNLLPGKYYVQEIETLDGYNRYTDLIEVDITLNESIDVIVNNTLRDAKEVTKETVEVVENKTESIKKLPVTGY